MTQRTITVTGHTEDMDDAVATNGGGASAGDVIVEYNDDDDSAVLLTALETAKAAILADISG